MHIPYPHQVIIYPQPPLALAELGDVLVKLIGSSPVEDLMNAYRNIDRHGAVGIFCSDSKFLGDAGDLVVDVLRDPFPAIKIGIESNENARFSGPEEREAKFCELIPADLLPVLVTLSKSNGRSVIRYVGRISALYCYFSDKRRALGEAVFPYLTPCEIRRVILAKGADDIQVLDAAKPMSERITELLRSVWPAREGQADVC